MLKIENVMVLKEEGFFASGAIETDGPLISRVSWDDSLPYENQISYIENKTDESLMPHGNGEVAVKRVSKRGKTTLDAGGCYAIPGLIDIHLHGCRGGNFYDADRDGLLQMLRYQAANGVTAICPTTLTLPVDVLEKSCAAIASIAGDIENDTRGGFSDGARAGESPSPESGAAAPIGVYLEGPFISRDKTGAQNPDFVAAPDISMFRRLQEASGNRVKVLAMAPEVNGALDLISALAGEVVISVAHTNTDYKTAVTAFERGAKLVTHLYNGMSGFTHREPGVVGAALDTPGVFAEMICDGVHLHPAAVRIAMKSLGLTRTVFISDSMMATGLVDGIYDLGGLKVRVAGKEARLVNGGNIASSVSNLMDCLRVAVRDVGLPLASAARCVSTNPALALGVENERGRIAEGLAADIVLLDKDLNIKEVIVRGRRLSM